MRSQAAVQIPVIEGYFRPSQSKRSVLRVAPTLLSIAIIAVVGFALSAPLLIVACLALVVTVLLFEVMRRRRQRVMVRLDGGTLTVNGDGYDVRLEAPFRFKTGVERKLATDDEEEYCFIRLVTDVRGKPLVLEEEVIAGSYPPPLDAIVGISSALGMAELTSLIPYPGTLWSLIERMEALAQAVTQSEDDETILSLNRIGEQQMAENQYAEAIQTFSAIIRQAPNAAAAYYGRGAARYNARIELDKAVNDLTTAIRLKPRQYETYRMRGLARAQQGDWAGLRDDSSAALKHHPTSAELRNLRGAARFRLQDFEGALVDFEQAIRLEPQRHESYYNRGLVRQRQGDLDGALADFQQAMRLNSDFSEAAHSIDEVQRQIAQQQARSQF